MAVRPVRKQREGATMRKYVIGLGIAAMLTAGLAGTASAEPIKAEDGTYVPGDYYTKERTPYRGYGTCKAQENEADKRLCKEQRDSDLLVKMSSTFSRNLTNGEANVCAYGTIYMFCRDGNKYIW